LLKCTTVNVFKLFSGRGKFFFVLLRPRSISHIRLSHLRYFFITSYYIKSIDNDKVTKTANNTYNSTYLNYLAVAVIQKRIFADKIKCNVSYIPMQKSWNVKPLCIRNETVIKLIYFTWAGFITFFYRFTEHAVKSYAYTRFRSLIIIIIIYYTA